MRQLSLVVLPLLAGAASTPSAWPVETRPWATEVTLLGDHAELIAQCVGYRGCTLDVPEHLAGTYVLRSQSVGHREERALRLRGSEVAISVAALRPVSVVRVHPLPPGVALSFARVRDRDGSESSLALQLSNSTHVTLDVGRSALEVRSRYWASWTPVTPGPGCHSVQRPRSLPSGATEVIWTLRSWLDGMPTIEADRQYRIGVALVVDPARFDLHATELGSRALPIGPEEIGVRDVFWHELLLSGSEILAADAAD